MAAACFMERELPRRPTILSFLRHSQRASSMSLAGIPPSFLGMPALKKLYKTILKEGRERKEGKEGEMKDVGDVDDVVKEVKAQELNDSTFRFSMLTLGKGYYANVDLNLKVRTVTYNDKSTGHVFDHFGLGLSITHKDALHGGEFGYVVDKEGHIMKATVSLFLFYFYFSFCFSASLAQRLRENYNRTYYRVPRRH